MWKCSYLKCYQECVDLFLNCKRGKSKQIKGYVTKEQNGNPNYAAICRTYFNDYHWTIFIDFESFRKPTVIYKWTLLSGKEWLLLWYLDN